MNTIFLLKMKDKGVYILVLRSDGCHFGTLEQFEISKVKGYTGVKTQICINVDKIKLKPKYFSSHNHVRRGVYWYMFWHELHKFQIWPLYNLRTSRIAQACHHGIRQDLEEHHSITIISQKYCIYTLFYAFREVLLDYNIFPVWIRVYPLAWSIIFLSSFDYSHASLGSHR